MEDGPSYFVDALKGSDSNGGTKDKPWKTINHAMRKLGPGDTLYLRGGTFYENVYCAAAGSKDAPITIRSFPGEQAVIDGGMPEFQLSPETSWEPCTNGAPGEYVSAKPYRNIRDVLGRFGDSNIGLQTYWHAMDMRAENELWIKDPETMVKPVYCGPGLWYEKKTGLIHARLAHTHIDNPEVEDYRGETDPRKLPMVVAAFNSLPLFVDQAMHVRFQDLVIRGAGFNAVVLQFGIEVEFDNVTVFAGSYAIRARSTGPLRIKDSALYGLIPPWAFRSENGLFTYTVAYYDPFLRELHDTPPDEGRNIARLPTHALLVSEGTFEFEIFAYPRNHDWEISYNEFADSHEAAYLGGINIRFHHNWVGDMQDDAVYLSSPTSASCDNLHVYQNLITSALTALGCHSYGGPDGNTYVYRNIIDMRAGSRLERPSPSDPHGVLGTIHVYLMHGSPFLGVESISFYQNTFVANASAGGYAMRTLTNAGPVTTRRVFNNLCIYLNTYRPVEDYDEPVPDIRCNGNLHWCVREGVEPPAGLLEQARACRTSQASKKHSPAGWEANSLIADPQFTSFGAGPEASNDYRLRDGSPAAGAGVVLPAELEDPLRPEDGARPDIGAIPLGGEPLRFGRYGRITFPLAGIPPASRP